MKWTKNNLACGATWTALLILDQNKRAFPNSADVTIGTFKMWAPGESAKLRAVRARSLATMLDNIFVSLERADYEKDVDRPAAIDAMRDVLVDDEQTLTDLASTVDDNYSFVGEKKS